MHELTNTTEAEQIELLSDLIIAKNKHIAKLESKVENLLASTTKISVAANQIESQIYKPSMDRIKNNEVMETIQQNVHVIKDNVNLIRLNFKKEILL